ncbi:MAG: magnesium chelatase ATPase subunit I [Hyphomicrobium sp.]
MRPVFPFTAIVGQDDLKLALLLAAIDPSLGGVLVLGDRGTGKSTAVRALAALLPPISAVAGCPYNSIPDGAGHACVPGCPSCFGTGSREAVVIPVPVVDLPLGATEDRVVGALDLEQALVRGEKRFEPGLLARANRGFLYIDEVNLLEDHLVDLLLDVAASGENVVEREGISIRHPARFVLVGSGNPEEGELRPQLLDRFGLMVSVGTPRDVPSRVEVVRRRDAFERNGGAFVERFAGETERLRIRISAACARLDTIEVPDRTLERAAEICVALGTDGLRGELTLIRAARALASFEGTASVGLAELRRIAPLALSHRLRRDPLDEAGSEARVARALGEVFGAIATVGM